MYSFKLHIRFKRIILLLLIIILVLSPVSSSLMNNFSAYSYNFHLPKNNKTINNNNLLNVSVMDYGDLPPESGDWIVNNPTQISNKKITINGSIYIRNDLTLYNVELILNDSSAPRVIENSAGRLTIINSTMISIARQSRIVVGDSITMENSTVIGFGYFKSNMLYFAVTISSPKDVCYIRNNIFINCTFGIHTNNYTFGIRTNSQASYIVISRNIFYHTHMRFLEIYASENILIEDNLFYGLDNSLNLPGFFNGVIIRFTKNITIRYNYFFTSTTAILFPDGVSEENKIIYNTFESNQYDIVINLRNDYKAVVYLNNFLEDTSSYFMGTSRLILDNGNYGNFYEKLAGNFTDNNNDGIADEPYHFNYATDHYPLMNEIPCAYPKVSIPAWLASEIPSQLQEKIEYAKSHPDEIIPSSEESSNQTEGTISNLSAIQWLFENYLLFASLMGVIILIATISIVVRKRKRPSSTDTTSKEEVIKAESEGTIKKKATIKGHFIKGTYEDILNEYLKREHTLSKDILNRVPLNIRKDFGRWLARKLIDEQRHELAKEILIDIKDFDTAASIMVSLAIYNLSQGNRNKAKEIYIELSNLMRKIGRLKDAESFLKKANSLK
ncbi:MAG: hypothetical protein ACP6IU_09870 [Candidatus Asgardarchaeia archaeon]